MRRTVILAAMVIVAIASSQAVAISLLAPGDAIIAIDTDPPGFSSHYPESENPPNILDGDPNTKYLNDATANSGFIITPAFGASVLQSFVITTANDMASRDPASWVIYGTNDSIVSADNSLGDAENWTLIGLGNIALPVDRRVAGPIVSIANATSYSSYKMVFPTLVDSNSLMQIAEVGFFDSIDGTGTNILALGDAILAIDVDPVMASSYPDGEPPSAAIDGELAKYLNFGKDNTGFIVTPSVSPQTIVTGFQITTADDSPDRDPTNWELYGTNDVIASMDNDRGDAEAWTLIDAGSTDLPVDRGVLGPMIDVTNTEVFSSYRMIFPDVRNADATDSMQIAEIQFEGTVVPEPSSIMLVLSGLLGLGLIGWRRRQA